MFRQSQSKGSAGAFKIIGAFVVMGAAFVAVQGVVLSIPTAYIGGHAVIGAAIGFASSIIGVILLQNKDFLVCAYVLYGVGFPCVIGSTLVWRDNVAPPFVTFFWFVATVFFLYFVLPEIRFPDGHCQSCGYDLTGNTSGVCPECGTNALSRVDTETEKGAKHGRCEDQTV